MPNPSPHVLANTLHSIDLISCKGASGPNPDDSGRGSSTSGLYYTQQQPTGGIEATGGRYRDDLVAPQHPPEHTIPGGTSQAS
jgi:hypothetical protein